MDKTHIHLFTYNEIMRLFQGTGFRVERVATRAVSISESDARLIRSLCAISPDAKPFMYETFQYLVKAVK